MDTILDNKTLLVILTLMIAAVGGAIFSRFRIPVGFLLGAMFFVMAANIITNRLLVPQFFVSTSRMLAGTIIGCKLSKNSFSGLRRMLIPMIFAIFLTLVLSVAAGYLVFSVSELSKSEAFFGTAPGGISDMSLISADFGADMSKVAILQLVRVIVCISVIPVLIRETCKRRPWMLLRNRDQNIEVVDRKPQKSKKKLIGRYELIKYAATFLVGFLGGMIGRLSGIPAGELTGAVVFVGAMKIKGIKLSISPKAVIIAQIVIGAVIGVSINRQSLGELGKVIIPVVVIGMSMLFIGLIIGYVIHKIWKLDIDTALLSTSPGGMTEMSLMAADIGADASTVASIHLLRVLTVIIMYPLLLRLFVL